MTVHYEATHFPGVGVSLDLVSADGSRQFLQTFMDIRTAVSYMAQSYGTRGQRLNRTETRTRGGLLCIITQPISIEEGSGTP